MFDVLYLFIKSVIESHHRRIETKRFLNSFSAPFCAYVCSIPYKLVCMCTTAFYGISNVRTVLELILSDEDIEASTF